MVIMVFKKTTNKLHQNNSHVKKIQVYLPFDSKGYSIYILNDESVYLSEIIPYLLTLKINAMIPGSTIIISCPHCGQYAKRQTLISFNTFGVQFWSDAKRITPMKPESPSLVLCKACQQFYWIKDAMNVAEINNSADLKEKYDNLDFI